MPNPDPRLLFAVQRGVVLSCVTQARQYGLWVLGDDSKPHVAAGVGARSDVTGCVAHWGEPVLAREPGSLEDPVENVLQYVAQCQPFESALAIWESALNKHLVDRQVLERLPFRGVALRLLEQAHPFADSGLETFVRKRLAWLKLPITAQAWVHGHRVDFLIGQRLVLQIDGATHVGEQRTSDNAHDAELGNRGYHVIRVGYQQVINHWPEVQRLIMVAIAQGRHRA